MAGDGRDPIDPLEGRVEEGRSRRTRTGATQVHVAGLKGGVETCEFRRGRPPRDVSARSRMEVPAPQGGSDRRLGSTDRKTVRPPGSIPPDPSVLVPRALGPTIGNAWDRRLWSWMEDAGVPFLPSPTLLHPP